MTQCPACNTPLRLVVESDVDIDVCDECHGIWLDPGELDALSDSNDFTPRKFTADELLELECPRCSTQHFAAVSTDLGSLARCGDCGGVFVEGDTLDELSKSDRSLLPSKESAETTIMSVEAVRGLFELLWHFGQH